MAEYDLVIRGGTFVDGTGVPRSRSDVAIKDGRVARISGRINPAGAKELDAGGCFVAPGAIDLHTHYDAQVNWDPYCSLSGWHGVTSLTIGQCGFGFAPTRPEDRDLNMRMMNRIEAIPLESMRKGMRWDWETFPEYMDSLDRQGLGLNVGALFPFSPLRGYVLGMMPARERTSVTEEELNQMKQLFYDGMAAGAFGFSSNMNMEDKAEDGSFLPSQVASREEFLALSDVLSQFGVGHIGQTLGVGLTPERRKEMRALHKEMMRVSGRPFNISDTTLEEAPEWVESCRAEGLVAMRQTGSTPLTLQFKLAEYNLFDYMPSWVQPLVGSPEERAAKLRDPEVRAAMKRDAEEMKDFRTDWSMTKVAEVVHERNHRYEGLTIQQLGEAMGKGPVDAFLDLALDEDLETEYLTEPFEDPERLSALQQKFMEPYSHISFSDGGAHTRFSNTSSWPVFWLSHWIRDKEIMNLEQAHHKMSTIPAWLAGFNNRGTLRIGDWADIMVYNPGGAGAVS